jgi:hypothetical protein
VGIDRETISERFTAPSPLTTTSTSPPLASALHVCTASRLCVCRYGRRVVWEYEGMGILV